MQISLSARSLGRRPSVICRKALFYDLCTCSTAVELSTLAISVEGCSGGWGLWVDLGDPSTLRYLTLCSCHHHTVKAQSIAYHFVKPNQFRRFGISSWPSL